MYHVRDEIHRRDGWWNGIGGGWIAFRCCLVLLLCGGCFLSEARAVTSVERLEAMVRKNPSNLKARYVLGKYYLRMKRYEDALRQWKYIVKVRPNLHKMYDRIGLVYFRMGNYRKARHVFRYVLSKYPDDSFARKGYTAATRRLMEDTRRITEEGGAGGGSDDGGGSASSSASGKDSGDGGGSSPSPEDLFYKGEMALMNENYEQALDCFRKCLDADYRSLDARFYIGRCYMETDQLEKARECFNEILKEYPSHAGAKKKLAMTYALDGDFATEARYLEEYLADNEDDAEAHYLLAIAYDKLKETAKCMKHAKKAIELDRDTYKDKLQENVKNSEIVKQVAKFAMDLLERTKRGEELTEEEIEEKAEEIGRLLGGDLDESEFDKDRLKEILRNPEKRQAVRRFMSSGRTKQDVEQLKQELLDE